LSIYFCGKVKLKFLIFIFSCGHGDLIVLYYSSSTLIDLSTMDKATYNGPFLAKDGGGDRFEFHFTLLAGEAHKS
jgi:hypothetical protein